jgi:hypothetical protein
VFGLLESAQRRHTDLTGAGKYDPHLRIIEAIGAECELVCGAAAAPPPSFFHSL